MGRPSRLGTQQGWLWISRDDWVEPSLHRDVGSLCVSRETGQQPNVAVNSGDE